MAALGGFLFGYDTAVIAGAIGALRDHFHLTAAQEGWAGASAIYGCLPGALAGGFLADRFGRKRLLLACAALYAGSGLWSALAGSFPSFLLSRFAGGLAIGISSMVCPTYIAEIAPERTRGYLGTLFQLGIVVGIFLVFFVNQQIQAHGDTAWNTSSGWRWMLGSESLPALVFLLLLTWVSESPRWLALRGDRAAAEAVLTKVAGTVGGQARAGRSSSRPATKARLRSPRCSPARSGGRSSSRWAWPCSVRPPASTRSCITRRRCSKPPAPPRTRRSFRRSGWAPSTWYSRSSPSRSSIAWAGARCSWPVRLSRRSR